MKEESCLVREGRKENANKGDVDANGMRKVCCGENIIERDTLSKKEYMKKE